MTEYDMEKTSGRTYRSDWTEKGRCHWQNEAAKWSLRTFRKHEVNPATCVNGDKTGCKKADLSFSILLTSIAQVKQI